MFTSKIFSNSFCFFFLKSLYHQRRRGCRRLGTSSLLIYIYISNKTNDKKHDLIIEMTAPLEIFIINNHLLYYKLKIERK
jgi:hypothetical protein